MLTKDSNNEKQNLFSKANDSRPGTNMNVMSHDNAVTMFELEAYALTMSGLEVVH